MWSILRSVSYITFLFEATKTASCTKVSWIHDLSYGRKTEKITDKTATKSFNIFIIHQLGRILP